MRKKCFGLLSVLLTTSLLSLNVFSNANAVNSPFSVYWRSYQIDSAAVVNQSGYITDEVGSAILLTYEVGHYKKLLGYSADFPVYDDTLYQNKTIRAELKVSQGLNDLSGVNSLLLNPDSAYISADTNHGYSSVGSCVGSRGNPNNTVVTYTCSLTLSGSSIINNAQIVIGAKGNATSSSQAVGVACGISISPECNHSIVIQGLSYTLSGSNDPTYEQNQTIISQNQVIIEQNQQMIDQDSQDRDNVQAASDSADDNADASQQQNEQATSSLLSVIGSFIQALGAPASNCQVRTDLGNIDLGTLDFCSGKPAELTPIINTVCAMVMCIPIYLIARDLFKRFVYITTFAQGGEYK